MFCSLQNIFIVTISSILYYGASDLQDKEIRYTLGCYIMMNRVWCKSSVLNCNDPLPVINFSLRTSFLTSTSQLCEQRAFRLFPSSKRDIICLDWCKNFKDVSTSYVEVNSLGITSSDILHSFLCPRLETKPGGSLELGASEICPGILLHYTLV